MSGTDNEAKRASANVVYLIGDENNSIRNSLLARTGDDGLHSGLTLDTKYYSCTVTLESFSSFDEARKATAYRKDDKIGAVIVNYLKDRYTLSQLNEALNLWEVETWIMVCKLLESEAVWATELRRLCVSEGLELVELNPLQESIAELDGYRELYGIPRIIQVLETINWNQKTLVNLLVGQNVLKSVCDCHKNGRCDCLSKKLMSKEVNYQRLADCQMFSKEQEQNNGFLGCEGDEFGDFQVPLSYSKEESETKDVGTDDRKAGFSRQDNVEKLSVGENASSSTLDQETEEQGSKETIDKLVGDDGSVIAMIKKFEEVRLHLSQMPFGRERQEYAANAMLQLVNVLGEDLLEDLTEEGT